MYCPQCAAEYRPGFTECSDCHVTLVEDPVYLSPTPQQKERARRALKGKLLVASALIGQAFVTTFWFQFGSVGRWVLPLCVAVGFAEFIAGTVVLKRSSRDGRPPGCLIVIGIAWLMTLVVSLLGR